MQVTLDASTIIAAVSTVVTMAMGAYIALLKFSFVQFRTTVEMAIASAHKEAVDAKSESSRIAGKFDKIEYEFNTLKTQVTITSTKYEHIEEKLADMSGTLTSLNSKIDKFLMATKGKSIPDSEG